MAKKSGEKEVGFLNCDDYVHKFDNKPPDAHKKDLLESMKTLRTLLGQTKIIRNGEARNTMRADIPAFLLVEWSIDENSSVLDRLDYVMTLLQKYDGSTLTSYNLREICLWINLLMSEIKYVFDVLDRLDRAVEQGINHVYGFYQERPIPPYETIHSRYPDHDNPLGTDLVVYIKDGLGQSILDNYVHDIFNKPFVAGSRGLGFAKARLQSNLSYDRRHRDQLVTELDAIDEYNQGVVAGVLELLAGKKSAGGGGGEDGGNGGGAGGDASSVKRKRMGDEDGGSNYIVQEGGGGNGSFTRAAPENSQAAKEAREAAKNARGAAKNAQIAARSAQNAATSVMKKMEHAQAAAENARKAAEDARKAAEDARKAAEDARKAAEDAQKAATTVAEEMKRAQAAVENAQTAADIAKKAANIAVDRARVAENEAESVRNAVAESSLAVPLHDTSARTTAMEMHVAQPSAPSYEASIAENASVAAEYPPNGAMENANAAPLHNVDYYFDLTDDTVVN